MALGTAQLLLAIWPRLLVGTGLTMAGTATGPAVATLVGVVVLADALRRGRAGAWWVALVLSAAEAVVQVRSGAVAATGPLLCWTGLAGLLLAGRGCWPGAVPARVVPAALRSFAAAAAVGATGALLVGWAGGGPSVAGVLGWGLGLGLLAASLPALYARPEQVAATGGIRVALRAHGGGSLGWQRTWAGFTTWYSPTGDVAVTYRLSAGSAIALGDPVGPRSQWPQAIQAFTAWSADQGLVVAWYAATPGSLSAHPTSRHLHIGEDAVLDLATLEFRGKRWQDVRTALNRAERDGIRLESVGLATADDDLRRQVAELSQRWVDDKLLPEMGFTLGGVTEALDPDVRTHLAVDAAGVVHGVTTWLPVHQEGVLVGWTLDLMRRRTDGFRPVMEFLIARSAQEFQAEGFRTMSLSVAPLARRSVDNGQDGLLGKGLDRVAAVLEPAYGFGSLAEFKAKFAPRFEPVYLVYGRVADLPDIAVAISRAYLPQIGVRDALRIGRLLAGTGRSRSVSD